VGNAYPHKDYYDLKFDIFPFKLYISKNLNSSDTYKIFSKRSWISGKSKFRTQVGKGALSNEVKMYLELDIPMLPNHLYMSLYPTKYYTRQPVDKETQTLNKENVNESV